MASKKESKGQRVKTFKCFIPQPDLSYEETQVVVYFKPDPGWFFIYDGAHMLGTVVDAAKSDSREITINPQHGHVTSNTLDSIVRGFENICKRYMELMKSAQKRKVIRFTFKRNRPYFEELDNRNRPKADDIGFCGSPAIHLTYEVLYQVGDSVYTMTDEGTPHERLHHRGHANEARYRDGDATTIDWTAEREEFFANMKAALITLIHRIEYFQQDLVANVDRAIAAGGMSLLLAPPKGNDQ